MADKESILLLHVDLDCSDCYKKIKKTLGKFAEIESYSFDEKQKKVTIKGPFDPAELLEKLLCKAGKCIRGYEIKETKEPAKGTKEPPKETKERPKETNKKPPKKIDDPTQNQKPENQPVPVMGIPILIYGACPSPEECCRDCSKGRPSSCCRDCSEHRPSSCCRDCSDGPPCSCGHGCSKGRPSSCCRECSECHPEDGTCKRCDYGSSTAFCSEGDSFCKLM